MENELVSVGIITGTHGYKGEMKVLPLTDFPERFKELRQVVLSVQRAWREVEIEHVKISSSRLLIKFKGIESKEEAVKYRGQRIQIHEAQIYPLPTGVYYHFQLKGLQVFDEEKGYLGELRDIIETGANDVYVVDSDRYGQILIPAIKQVIRQVDLAGKTMQVFLLPGLIDDDRSISS